jgi:hypothetical protein
LIQGLTTVSVVVVAFAYAFCSGFNRKDQEELESKTTSWAIFLKLQVNPHFCSMPE